MPTKVVVPYIFEFASGTFTRTSSTYESLCRFSQTSTMLNVDLLKTSGTIETLRAQEKSGPRVEYMVGLRLLLKNI